uniref:Uncharacterized protein n=1 Tax=Arundo donax TaxID=35708 RepID=A0A0A9DI43_ARUDO
MNLGAKGGSFQSKNRSNPTGTILLSTDQKEERERKNNTYLEDRIGSRSEPMQEGSTRTHHEGQGIANVSESREHGSAIGRVKYNTGRVRVGIVGIGRGVGVQVD